MKRRWRNREGERKVNLAERGMIEVGGGGGDGGGGEGKDRITVAR